MQDYIQPEPRTQSEAPGPVHFPAGEPNSVRYLRHSRNATVWIAVCVTVFTALLIIGIIIEAHAAAVLNSPVITQSQQSQAEYCVMQSC
jgi:hypothetical protein